MRKILLFIFTVALIWPVGCGKKSPTGGLPVEEAIIGEWLFTRGIGGTGMSISFEFREDGTATYHTLVTGGVGGGGEPQITGTYEISGNQLTFTDDEGDSTTYTIEFIDPDRLRIDMFSSSTTVFKRVND